MPPKSKRRSNKSLPNLSEVVAPGGGTETDIKNLSRTLGLDADSVRDILNCQGEGITAVRSSRSQKANTPGVTAASTSSAWADFMSEEGFGASSKATTTTTTTSTTAGKREPTVVDSSASKRSKRSSEVNDNTTTSTTTAVSSSSSLKTSSIEHSSREYILPIHPRMQIQDNTNTKSSTENNNNHYITPGILAQTGTLDSSTVGRTKRTLNHYPQDITEPTILGFSSIFQNTPIAFIATSSSACHSLVIDIHGNGYTWGRNEFGQCGVAVGNVNKNVALPTKIQFKDEKLVGGAVGKSHTLIVTEKGNVYAVGSNKCGQCGVNKGEELVSTWKKCVIVGDDKDKDIQIVQASCGEQFSVLLSSKGHIYTCGLAEFGQLGNGRTGEYIIAAGKIGFDNATKFERRSEFVQSAADATTTTATEHEKGMIPMEDSQQIVIGHISCGRNHTIAVEAGCKNPHHTPRVFSWGCGDYGCLGHVVQADEYKPRLIVGLRGPLFTSNKPMRGSAGASCSMILTENGHVYYWGKHRSVGEATMRPTLVDALANNLHVVTCLSAGLQTVFCSTSNGVTISWGNGQYGELGYGSEVKSSAKPKFVEKLDKCLLSDVSCGYGHTLFLIRDEDEEDKEAWKKITQLECDDLSEFVESLK